MDSSARLGCISSLIDVRVRRGRVYDSQSTLLWIYQLVEFDRPKSTKPKKGWTTRSIHQTYHTDDETMAVQSQPTDPTTARNEIGLS